MLSSKRVLTALLLLISASASAEVDSRLDATDRLTNLIRHELTKKYSGAKIDLTSSIHWTRGELSSEVKSISLLNETAQGEVQFVAQGLTADDRSEGWVRFMASMPAKIALRRIRPGEVLNSDLFVTQNINVAVGQAREFRGLIFSGDADVNGLETRQTILEGQFLMSSAVQRVPNVRRGDAVRIHIISGDLNLTTMGIAEEPAYLKGQVRVMTGKNKRELVGRLQSDGIVEVKL